eukprot:TRINITY_DN105353_c0_g1_i1.p1 TRINITY_DN105353_c0_g1~~TRINITY_DN105353_c0_g1_i1.p1  ORF type:complete len:480 (+),score=69.26 TRINITY_DN105353_c0_g1_i1:73-1512(+)
MGMAENADSSEVVQPRVVSLLSGLTEAMYAMGLEHLLVGRSHECNHPPEVLALPQVSQPHVNPQAPAATIDAEVHESMQASGTAYKLRIHELERLKPTHLLVQDSCRVCAVSPGDLELCSFVAKTDSGVMRGQGLFSGCQIVTVFPKCLEDVFTDVTTVGDAVGESKKAADTIARFRWRLRTVGERAQGAADVLRRQVGPGPKPRVAVLEWCDPLMGCGYWIPELVELAGGQCVFGGVGEHTEYIYLADIATAKPDYIIFACCGFDVERSVKEICQTTLLTDPRWKKMAAVRDNKVFVCDGNRYFNVSGPSVVDTAEIIAQILGLMPETKYGPEVVMTMTEALARFQMQPKEMLKSKQGSHEECMLPLGGALEVVQATVKALQSGTKEGIDVAYRNSCVSASMPLELYINMILKNPDFLPLSDKSLTSTFEEPVSVDSCNAKVQVTLQGQFTAMYVFRMVVDEAEPECKWMIHGVSKSS